MSMNYLAKTITVHKHYTDKNMPTYDYTCEECGHNFEEFMQGFANRDKPTEEPCPECGKVAVKREWSKPSIIEYEPYSTKRMDQGWQDTLAKVAEKHPAHNMAHNFRGATPRGKL